MPHSTPEKNSSDSLTKLNLWMLGIQALLILFLSGLILPAFWHTIVQTQKYNAQIPAPESPASTGLTEEQLKKQMDRLVCELKKLK